MQPSEVRERVLHDHQKLRARVERLERLARAVIEGDQGRVEELRDCADLLLARLAEHMRWEDLYLAPALEEADAWGPERAMVLAEDHREQRVVLQGLIERLTDPEEPAPDLAEILLEWVERLHRDMEDEEACFLDPRILRDDVVAIDVETG